jgi:hypothetical protein
MKNSAHGEKAQARTINYILWPFVKKKWLFCYLFIHENRENQGDKTLLYIRSCLEITNGHSGHGLNED